MRFKMKNILSIVLALLMIFGNAAVSPVVTDADDSIRVFVTLQRPNGGFVLARQEYAVSPGLAEEYGFSNDGLYVDNDEISVLDALVAAHIAVYGEDGVAGALDISSGDYGASINEAFGTTGNFTFRVNGESPHDGAANDYSSWGMGNQYTGYNFDQAKISDGDVVEFMQGYDWGDIHAWFEHDGEKTGAIEVMAGESFSVDLKGVDGSLLYNIPEEKEEGTLPVANAEILSVTVTDGAGTFGDVLAETDGDGSAALTFRKPGTYILTVNASATVHPWLTVTVKAHSVAVNLQKAGMGFVLANKLCEVYPGLAEEYGFSNDVFYMDDNEISVLDALVAAHTAVYGEDGVAGALDISSGAYGASINEAFGTTGNFTFRVNGESPHDGVANDYSSWGMGNQYTGYNFDQAKISDGDVVEFMQDFDWDSSHAWFEFYGEKAGAVTVPTGESFTVDLKGFSGAWAYNIPEEREANTTPLANAAILPVTLTDGAGTFGTALAVTNANGTATLRLNEGTYILSVNDASIISPWLEVTVQAEGEIDNDVTEATSLIDALPSNITLADKAAVEAAKAAFDLLTNLQQAKIPHARRTKLTSAAEKIANLEAITAVEAAINALPSTVTTDDKAEVQSARTSYNALTNTQKALVGTTVLKKLLDAEAAIYSFENLYSVMPTAAELREILEKTAAYQLGTIVNPTVGTSGGDWTVMALARDGSITEEFRDIYLTNLTEYLKNRNGVLASPGGFYTEYSRVILALTSIGADPTDMAGYNLLASLAELENVRSQGLNGVAFALIALDSKGYEIPALPDDSEYTQTTRKGLIDILLDSQHTDGGWAISPSLTYSSIDYTAMAVTALAPYSGDYAVKAALDKAVVRLSNAQSATTAGYGAAEYDAQVIVALNALDIPLDDERFVKNDKTIYHDLMLFFVSSSGAFRHTVSGGASAIATDQSMYALVSLYRAQTGASKLYDMTDADSIDARPFVPDANKTLIEELLKSAASLTEALFTAASREALQEALTKAEQAVNRSDISQTQVDSAKNELIAAIGELEFAPGKADASVLGAVNTQISALVEGDYTSPSWAALQTASASAAEVLSAAGAAQEAIDAALDELLGALGALSYKVQSDKSLINITLTNAENITDIGYTAASWNEFRTALNNAAEIAEREDAAQTQVNLANELLQTAIDSLVVSDGTPGGGGTRRNSAKLRVIGAAHHPESDGYGKDTEYQNWLKTVSYSFDADKISVYELFTAVMSRAGLGFREKSGGYINAVQAPRGYGGAYLAEFDNGPYSGWMFTINGKHPGYGMTEFFVEDGDAVVVHYVDDFTLETDFEDNAAKYPKGWMKIADIDPPSTSTGGSGGSGGGSSANGSVIAPTASVKDGKAAATVTDAQAAAAIKVAAGGTITVKPAISGDAAEVDVTISEKAFGDIVKSGSELKIETPIGSVTPDAAAQNAIAAAKGEVTFTVSRSADGGEISLIITSGTAAVDLAGTKAVFSVPYELKDGESGDKLTVQTVGGGEISCTYNAQTKCVEFTADASGVYVIASDEAKAVLPFSDVSADDSFFDAVRFVYENRIMLGTGEGEFSPNADITRAMLATILYRYEGEPNTSGENRFVDVPDGEWYSSAVAWAFESGLMLGYSDTEFGTNDCTTREQMITIFHRYARRKGLDEIGEDVVVSVDNLSSWALDAVRWAKGGGIIGADSGIETAPAKNATRFEVAEIIKKLAE